MPILQQQPRESETTKQIIAASLDSPQDLEYPHGPLPAKTSDAVMPLVLWSLCLLLGILMLLARTPINAPPFESVTQYVCDPLPRLRNLGNRFQSYTLRLRCRAGDQVIFQRQPVNYGSNWSGLNACKLEGGLTRIWRMAPPSAYGGYVFHSTCGDHILMYYKNRVAVYDSIQRFVIAIACGVILISAIGLGRKTLQQFRLRAGSSDSAQHS